MGGVAFAQPVIERLLQAVNEQAVVPGPFGMPHRLAKILLMHEIAGGPAMNRRDAVGHVDGHPGAQEILEQCMVTIPAGLAGHRDQKQLPGGQLLNQAGGAIAVQHLVAHLGIETVQQRALHEQGTGGIGQAFQDCMAEVLHQLRLAGIKVLQGLHTGTHGRKQGNLDPRHPAFGDGKQMSQLVLVQGRATQAFIERGNFLATYLQVGGADLHHSIVQPQTTDIKGRLGTTGNNQMDVCRWLVQQGADDAEGFRAANMLEVIKDNEQGLTDLLEGIKQGIGNGRWWQLGHIEGHEPGGIKRRHHCPGLLGETAQKAHRIIIHRTQVQGHHRTGLGPGLPLAEQGGFAGPGRGQQQGQWNPGAMIQQCHQFLPVEPTRSGPGRISRTHFWSA